MLSTVKARMEAMEITLTATDEALGLLAETGFDPVYGARPLRRAIQSTVEDTAAERILDGSISRGDQVSVVVKDGKIDIVKE